MRVAVLSDIHFPYQSEAWDMAVELVRQSKPDRIVLLGDIVDFYQVSHFMTEPIRRFELQSDLDVAYRELLKLRKAASNAEMVFKEGNHELRLQKYLFTQAAELSGLKCLALPELLRFGDLGISKFIKNNEKYRIGHLWYLHGNEVRTGSVHPARGMYQKVGVNVVFGHVHKFDRHGDHSLADKEHAAWSNACLCSLTPDYMFNPQWENGFMQVDYVDDLFCVQQIKFFPHKGTLHTVYNGHMIKATKSGKLRPLISAAGGGFAAALGG